MNATELDLIQREVDGENSPEESRRVQTLLANDSAARKEFDDLSFVAEQLRLLEAAEPPADLKRKIMAALPVNLYAARRADPSPARRRFSFTAILEDVKLSLTARPALVVAYAFSIGLLVGLGLYAAVVGGIRSDQDSVVGTIVSSEAAERLEEVNRIPIELPGLAGSAEVYASSDLLVVELDLRTDVPTEVVLLPGEELALRGFARKTEYSGTAIDVANQNVRLTLTASDRVEVIYNRTAGIEPSFRMEVRRAGEVIHDTDLMVR